MEVQFYPLIPKGRFRRYNFCLRLSHANSGARAARLIQKKSTQLSSLNIAYTYDPYDIFCDVHDSRKRVVVLIYKKQFLS